MRGRERRISRGPHFNLCSFVGLFNMPATCRCHASTCRPSSGYSNYLPPPLQLPSPLSPGNINRRAYYTMRCVPGSMEELPLCSCSLVLLSPNMLYPSSSSSPSLCILHTKHAATFLASSRCVCICSTVRPIGKGGAQNFLCCICPVAAQQEEGQSEGGRRLGTASNCIESASG